MIDFCARRHGVLATALVGLAALPAPAQELDAALVGSWASDPKECAAASSNVRLDISPTTMSGASWLCTVARVVKQGDGWNIGLACSASGNQYSVDSHWQLQPNGNLRQSEYENVVEYLPCHNGTIAQATNDVGGTDFGTERIPSSNVDAVRTQDSDAILYVQRRLDELGFDPGRVDGQFGARTSRALRAFEIAKGLPGTGQINAANLAALAEAGAGETPTLPKSGGAPVFDPDAIQSTIRTIISEYTPTADVYDYRDEAGRAALADLLKPPPFGSIDVSGFETQPVKLGDGSDGYRFYASPEHKVLVADLKATRLGKGGMSDQQAKDFDERFRALLAQTKGRFGGSHPAVGFVLDDVAELRAEIIARFEGGLGAFNLELSGLYREVAKAMLGGWSLTPSGRLVTDRLVANLNASGERALDWIEGCRELDRDVYAVYIEAAAISYAAHGARPRQAGLLLRAARCAEDPRQAEMVMRARIQLARMTGSGEVQAQSLAEFAAMQFSAGDKAGATAAYKEAFRLAIAYGLAAGYEEGFLSDDEWTSNKRTIAAHWQALRELDLTAELDLYIAQVLNRQIADRSFESTYGASLVSSFSDVLEGSGRTQLTDQYYTYLGHTYRRDSLKGSTSPLYMMSLFAAQRIDSERYDEALLILERGLKLAEQVGHRDFTLVMVAQLARAHTERGALDEGLAFARRGLVLLKQGDVDTSAFDVKAAIEAIDKIAANAEREQSRLDNAVSGLAKELQGKLDSICDSAENAWAFPPLPVRQILSNPVITDTFLQHPVAARYIECFDRRREEFSDKAVQPGDGIGDRVSDATLLLGLLGEKERATALLEFLFAKGEKSLGAQASAVRGLVRAGKGEWFSPYAVRATDFAIATLGEHKQPEWFPVPVTAMGLDLLAIGERDLSQSIYRYIRADLDGRAGSDSFRCMLEDCQYLAVMAEAFDGGKGADTYFGQIAREFTLFNSGAQADTKEANTIRELALYEGQMQLRSGRYRLAEVYFQLASEIVSNYGPTAKGVMASEGEVEVATAMSRIKYERGDRTTAHSIAAPLVAEARKRFTNRNAYSTEAIVRWSHRLRGLFEVYFDSLDAGPDGEIPGGEDDFFAFQYLQTTRTAATVAKIAERARAGSGEAVRRHQDISRELTELYSAFAIASGDRADTLLEQITAKERDSAAAQQAAETSDPTYAARPGFRFLSLAETRERLGEGEAALLTFVGRDHAYLWLVTHKTASLRRLTISPATLEKEVRALRTEATGYNEGVENRRWPLETFRKPYLSTLGTFGDTMAAVSRLYVVPHGLFDGLPFAALLDGDPPTESMTFQEMRAAKLPWVIRRTAINMLPSLQAIEPLSRSVGDSAEHRPFLGIGNPDFGAGLKVASLRGLSPVRPLAIPMLPETQTEITRIAKIIGAEPTEDLLVGARASETVIRGMALDRYRILTFATHGILAGEFRGVSEPALVLAMPANPQADNDGLLTASEVSSLRLDAELVVLSACNTAGSDGRPGAEGLSGLANAFFYAGAQNLVVTHWAIPSNPAVDISVGMIEAHQGTAQMDWAKALQTSVIKMMDGDGPVAYVHPGAWGAHMVVGAKPNR